MKRQRPLERLDPVSGHKHPRNTRIDLVDLTVNRTGLRSRKRSVKFVLGRLDQAETYISATSAYSDRNRRCTRILA